MVKPFERIPAVWYQFLSIQDIAMRSVIYRSPENAVLTQEYKALNGGCVTYMANISRQARKLSPMPAVYVPTKPRCSPFFVTP